jgi:hypothetical protein
MRSVVPLCIVPVAGMAQPADPLDAMSRARKG